MRIAITLQSLRHQGGIGVYTRQIVKHLLRLDQKNEYVLVYPTFGQAHKSLGQFDHRPTVTEVLSPSLIPHGIYWDQCVVPRLLHKNGVDLLFNPFQSVPLLGRFKKVLTLHNSEWFIMPHVFGYIEKFNGKVLLKPILRAADTIISVSHKVATDLMRATGLPPDRFRVIHNGTGDNFKPISDPTILDAAKRKYRLPDEFVLFVGGIYPQKNFITLLRAFNLVASSVPHHLVVAGHLRWKSQQDVAMVQELKLEDRVTFLGWVDHDDLPAIYNLATCFVIPSLHESCSVALIEALSCGCPVIASRSGGNPEVVGDAAILVDPHRTTDIADAILKLLSDSTLRSLHRQRGLQRARDFTWEKSAQETLKVLNEFN